MSRIGERSPRLSSLVVSAASRNELLITRFAIAPVRPFLNDPISVLSVLASLQPRAKAGDPEPATPEPPAEVGEIISAFPSRVFGKLDGSAKDPGSERAEEGPAWRRTRPQKLKTQQ
jgi:hypothetical protein